MRELQRLVGADKIAHRQQAAGCFHDGLARLRVGRVVGFGRAGRDGGVSFLRVDIGDNRRRAEKSARNGKAHHADAAEPDQQNGTALRPAGMPLKSGVRGQAGAHQRPGKCRRQRRVVEQVARMRNKNMRGEPAIDRDAEVTMVRAQILFATAARGTDPATDPGIDRDTVADLRIGCILACAFDHAGNLVTERERQGPSGADIELFVAAEGEVAVLQMQVGMAYAATLDANQHFAAARLWTVDDRLAKRLPVSDQRLAVHLAHVGRCSTVSGVVGIMP